MRSMTTRGSSAMFRTPALACMISPAQQTFTFSPRLNTPSQRYFGIVSSATEKMSGVTEKRKIKKQMEEFKKQMAELSELDRFSFPAFVKVQEETLHKSGSNKPQNKTYPTPLIYTFFMNRDGLSILYFMI